MDMENSQESSHLMPEPKNEGHDCCDPEDSESQEGCDGEMNCGFCFANVPALPEFLRLNSDWVSLFSLDFSSGFIFPSHSSPPFRPPIS